ncbi:hypothetical protein QNK12_19055 [Neobacillus cucumis]|nr:hypothetical protein QNK12_19055 [Neobacillus cucumis]
MQKVKGKLLHCPREVEFHAKGKRKSLHCPMEVDLHVKGKRKGVALPDGSRFTCKG